MKTVTILSCLALWLCLVSTHVSAKTQCSLKIPVPDLNYCDAIGFVEEHVDADMHETRGRIRAVQDFQFDSFKLLDGQINAIMNESTSTDENINDVEEEILVLKQFVETYLDVQADDTVPKVDGTRQKRAATSSPNQIQQQLNTAKASFQQDVTKVLQKLQSISSSIANEVSQSSAIHLRLVQELSNNQQTLTATEQQLQSLETAVRNALNTTRTGGGGVSLSGVSQDVTDLIINATVSEKVIQRQLDNIDKVVKQMEASEQVTDTKISTLTTDLKDLNTQLNNATQQTATLKGADRIFEDQVGAFVSNTTQDVANIKADLVAVKQTLSQVGRSVFNTTLEVAKFDAELLKFRKSVDSVQTVVTFTQPLQQGQIADILRLKKTLADNVNVLKYAFGLTSTPP